MRRLALGLLAIGMLLSIAYYNGYPTIFSDTGGYLWSGAFFKAIPPFRAPGYAVFARVTSLELSAWFIVLVQAAIVVYVLFKACDYLVDGQDKFRSSFTICAVLFLTLLTSLPWLVSLILPDVFAGLLFLSAFLVGLYGGLRTAERLVLAAIVGLSAASHSSLLPIALASVAAILVFSALIPTSSGLAPKKFIWAWLIVPVIAAGLATASLNLSMNLGFRLAPAKNDFLLAGLFGDGLAGDFLRENCPSQPFVACRYLSNLPKTENEFLFVHPMLKNIDQREIDAIVDGTLRAFPLKFLAMSARNTMRQLISFRTGDEIATFGEQDWNTRVIKRVLPADFLAFRADKQMGGRLLPLVDAAARLDAVAFWISLAACALFAWLGRYPQINKLFYAALMFSLINAAVCATVAGVFGRYQSRVAWLVPFCFAVYLGAWVSERNTASATQRTAPITAPLQNPD